MPTYRYEYDDGSTVDVFQRMTDEALVEIDGRPVRRAFCPPVINTHPNTGKYPYVSSALPTTIKGCKMVRTKPGGRLKPLIESRRHEKEIAARYDLVKV